MDRLRRCATVRKAFSRRNTPVLETAAAAGMRAPAVQPAANNTARRSGDLDLPQQVGSVVTIDRSRHLLHELRSIDRVAQPTKHLRLPTLARPVWKRVGQRPIRGRQDGARDIQALGDRPY